MPTAAEFNQFRRLIGDNYATPLISDVEVTSYFNDAVWELTGDFATPLADFDTLITQYHNEVIYKAAINWWWNDLAVLQDRHSITVGQQSQNVSEKWDRAMKMIEALQVQYDIVQQLRVDITIGNYSRYSKQTLRRIGGIREEDTTQ